MRSVPVRGDVQYVCTFLIDFSVLNFMFAYLEINMCERTIYRYIYRVIDK